MSYIVRYRAGTEHAQGVAKIILASVVKDKDPARERAHDRSAAMFASPADDFLSHIEVQRKPNTLAQHRHMLKTYAVPKFGTRKAASITPTDVAALHQSLREKSAAAPRTPHLVPATIGARV